MSSYINVILLFAVIDSTYPVSRIGHSIYEVEIPVHLNLFDATRRSFQKMRTTSYSVIHVLFSHDQLCRRMCDFHATLQADIHT